MASSRFIAIICLMFAICIPSAHTEPVSECPVNFSYVRELPWDRSSCETKQNVSSCCQTLLSVFGIGLSQFLKDSSIFELPNRTVADTCMLRYQTNLTALSRTLDGLVPRCFPNVTRYVSSRDLCAGIQTLNDWNRVIGNGSAVDTTCSGDLTVTSTCTACTGAGVQAVNTLVGSYKSSSSKPDNDIAKKCFYFVCLYAAGVANRQGPMSLGAAQCILRVPFVSSSRNNSRVLIYALASAIAAFVLLCVGAVCYYYVHKKKSTDKQTAMMKISMRRPNTGAVWVEFEKICKATDDFSKKNLIGAGGFGTVYKGVLRDGAVVAIKRIHETTSGDTGGSEKFMSEAEIINGIRHKNLVALRGYCIVAHPADPNSDEREYEIFLIYDYFRNGSLDEHLFGEKPRLSWAQRRRIILGVAKGLSYLHNSVTPAIFHRDIKPTNILLDEELNACLADFGLARIVSAQGASHMTTRVAGTHGYLAPEYALYGQLTDRSDVYSFGVVVLEIVSGRRALHGAAECGSDYLITDWAWRLMKCGKEAEILDKMLVDENAESVAEMLRFVRVGILCAHVLVAFRPGMSDAVKMLDGDVKIPQIPDRPLPVIHGYSLSCDRLMSPISFDSSVDDLPRRPKHITV